MLNATPNALVAPHLRQRPSTPVGPGETAKLTREDPKSRAPETSRGPSKLATAVLGAGAILGIANGASAQEAATLPTTISTRQEAEDPEVSFGFSQTNDSLPQFLQGLGHGDDLRPGSAEGDDDGWTAELRLDLTRTRGNTQDVISGRYSMLTEQDAWNPGPNYGDRRTDLGELSYQRNTRHTVNDRLDIITGIGGGLQATGNLGGLRVQEGFHIHGGFGGRTGEALQRVYSTDHIDYAPLVTGGIGADLRLNEAGTATLRGSVQTNLALGPGISSARSELGLELQPREWLTLEGGAKLDAVYATSNAYDFAHVNGVRPGYYAQAEARILGNVRGFARVEDGGFRDEPVYTIGFRVGLGSRPWLDPSGR